MKYLKCAKCGKIDKPDKSVIPHNPGTAVIMHCPYCRSIEDYFATLCRKCCPTGHGTK